MCEEAMPKGCRFFDFNFLLITRTKPLDHSPLIETVFHEQ